MNYNALFEEVGFIYEYRNDFEQFFRPFFENDNKMMEFFFQVFKNDENDKRPRWMMNDIYNTVTLARDIDKIRPKRDSLRILFFRICLEAISKDSGKSNKDFFDTFDTFFSNEGKQYILSHFVFSGINIPDDITGIERASFDTYCDYQLTCADFVTIMRSTRNIVAHEGDYWSMQFFAHDSDSTWLTCITTDEEVVACQPKQKGKKLTYCFHTTMLYEMFEYYFVEACINYIMDYIGNGNKNMS